MTSAVARSKVDLHLASGRELIRLTSIHGDHVALTSAAVLQFEMALGFYLLELAQFERTARASPWPISTQSLLAQANQSTSQDLVELSVLSQDDESWLHRMLTRMALLRRCDSTRTIKGEFFQSDLHETSSASSLIASSQEGGRSGMMDARGIAEDLDAFAALLVRQRLGHEEY